MISRFEGTGSNAACLLSLVVGIKVASLMGQIALGWFRGSLSELTKAGKPANTQAGHLSAKES